MKNSSAEGAGVASSGPCIWTPVPVPAAQYGNSLATWLRNDSLGANTVNTQIPFLQVKMLSPEPVKANQCWSAVLTEVRDPDRPSILERKELTYEEASAEEVNRVTSMEMSPS